MSKTSQMKACSQSNEEQNTLVKKRFTYSYLNINWFVSTCDSLKGCHVFWL